MSRDEAVHVLALVSAHWPTFDPPDATVEVWIAHLIPNDFERAAEAVRRLGKADHFCPSVARFKEMYRAVDRRYEPTMPALPERDPPAEGTVKACIAEARALLRGPKS